jgi:hypothetical protein
MLGVRRPGVTVASHILEGERLIKSNRSEIVILDRAGFIEKAAAYGVAESEYERLITKSATWMRPYLVADSELTRPIW